MDPHIYFWPPQVEKFKSNNLRVKKIFEDTKISKELLWSKYEDEIKKEFSNISYGPGTDSSDFADLYEDRLSDAADILWHAISIHKFQFLVLLCQTWESELISFVTKELKNYYTVPKPLEYRNVMDEMLLKNMDENRIIGLSKIRELRWLVNVIKHGDGPSAQKLRNKRPDFFQYNTSKFFDRSNDRLEIWSSVLLDGEALNVNEKEFDEYFKAINNFWESMPVRVFIDSTTPPIYQENGIGNKN